MGSHTTISRVPIIRLNANTGVGKGIMNPRVAGLLALSMEVLAFRVGRARAGNDTSSAQAWDLAVSRDPRAVAMAGGDFAVGGSVGASLANPAALTVSRAYELVLFGNWSPEAGLAHYGGAIADSLTSRTAGGISAHWTSFDTPGLKRRAIDVRGSAAYPLGDALSLGVAGRWLRTADTLGTGSVGGAPAARTDVERARLALDVGLLLQPAPIFRLGVVAKNLVAEPSFDLPRLYGAGVGFSFDTVSVESTALVNLTNDDAPRWRSGTGVGWSLAERYAFRFGYRYDQALATHAIGAGVSIADRSGALEVGVRRDVAGPFPATFIAVGFRVLMGGLGPGDSDSSTF
jgi:hypothetical protein